MSSDRIDTILSDYQAKRELYEQFAMRVEALVRELLAQNAVQVHTVAWRAKGIESLRRKLAKKITYASLVDITDLAGVRIITHFAEDVDRVASILDREFEIDRANTVDRRTTLDPDRFGYLSMHHVVRLHPTRRALTEYRRFPELKAEIQTRSILQHAWAEIEHDLGYKAGNEVPRHIRRRFSRVAGLLELADQEFEVIRADLAKYEARVEGEIRRDPTAVSLDKVSIMAFATTDPLVARTDQAIAALEGQSGLGSYTDPEHDVRRFTWLGLSTIGEIRTALEERADDIVRFAAEWFKVPDEEYDPEEEFPQGISLFYLGYLLVAAFRDAKRTAEYLNSLNIGPEYSRDEVAHLIIEVYDSICVD